MTFTSWIWPRVLTGDLGAIDRLVRLLERQARLLGLDAPVEVAVAERTLDEVDVLVAEFTRLVGVDEHEPSAQRDAEVARLEGLLGCRTNRRRTEAPAAAAFVPR